ncbi:LPXTG-motif cell wall-anchored protein [Leifsonia sp. AK011]|uniref:LPXTG cell wall anchor domain-containing protein n=1 Tax=Leifsonia sp. AK011 TaxID=2723075 RepID=UPI0015CBABDB|nr:LPXTG cell wall anchor domain-containing protein [Leifsonia sp. AK011]NYF09443.1 LPXTG-motif cell wall-anchored protein [Leifsonia sp. AK011]
MRRTLGVATALVGIAALTFAASPANAASLPAGDKAYILPCDSDEFNGLLYEVDTTTGVATQVGDWENPDTDVFACAGPAAYNPVNGLGYWISWANSEGYLISVDLTTGENTVVGQFTIEGEPYYTPIAIAIDAAGNAWATSWSVSPDVLYSLDLSTAALTEVGPTGVTDESDNYGLAWDSVTKTVYAYNVGTEDFYTVDTTTGAFTTFAEDVFGDVVPYAIAFDSAGQVWGINEDIISAPITDFASAEVLSVINPDPNGESPEDNIYSESILIVPAPAPAPAPAPEPVLAATGSDNGNLGMLVGFGALLVVAGAVIARRRTA